MPYPIFAYAGLVPWQFFSTALTESSNSLVNNKSLITKIYFPRVVIPCSGVFAALVDFTIAFLVLLGMMVYLPHPAQRGDCSWCRCWWRWSS